MKINKICLTWLCLFIAALGISQQQPQHFLIGMGTFDHDGVVDGVTGDPTGFDTPSLLAVKEYNFNTLIAWSQLSGQPVSSNPDLSFLDRAYKAGINIILGTPETSVNKFNPVCDANTLSGVNDALSYYDDHPAVVGYYVSDEPCASAFDEIGCVTQEISQNSEKLPFVQLWPEYAPANLMDDCDNSTTTWPPGRHEYAANYIESYITNGNPQMIGLNYFPIAIQEHPDYPNSRFCRWVRGFFWNLDTLGRVAANLDVPFYSLTGNYLMKSNYNPTDGCEPIQAFHYNILGMNDITNWRYHIYGGLMHGAKGILYFNREASPFKNNGNQSQWVIWDTKTDIQIKEQVGEIHKKILDHECTLMDLKFRNSFHVANYMTINYNTLNNGAGINIHDYVDPHMQWANRTNDPIVATHFHPTSPVFPAPGPNRQNPTDSDRLAFSFLTDKSGGEYFWVMNKSIDDVINSTINFTPGQAKVVLDILEDHICTNVSSIDIELKPGQGKLFSISNYNPGNDPLVFNTNVPTGNEENLMANAVEVGANTTVATGAVLHAFAQDIEVSRDFNAVNGSTLRLKALDGYCGIFRQSEEAVTEEINQAKDIQIGVYPNPAKDQVTVDIASEYASTALIEVFNAGLQKMKIPKSSLDLAENSSSLELDTKDWPAGIYFIVITQEGRVLNKKLIIQK